MSAPTEKTDYLLLFRGTNWDKELSPEQLQKVVSDWAAWFERLTQEGKCKGGHPLQNEGKLVSMVGVGVKFKITGEETGHAFSIVERPFEPRTLVPPHVHPDTDEYSYVVEAGSEQGSVTRSFSQTQATMF